MNPWYLLALLAGAIGVGTLASNASKAAMPRVTAWALNILPRPGTGQWDLWVTGLNGLTGPAMLALIPGGQMIYIPAAKAMSEPATADWTYTFTPAGSARSMSIVVPAAVIAAYQKAPKTQALKAATASHVFSAQQGAILAQGGFVQQMLAQHDLVPQVQAALAASDAGAAQALLPQAQNAIALGWEDREGNVATLQSLLSQLQALAQGQAPPPSSALGDAQQLVKDVKALIASFPTSGAALDIAAWAVFHIVDLGNIIGKVNSTLQAIQSGNLANATDIQNALQTALTQLQTMLAQSKQAQAQGSGGGGGGDGTIQISPS